MGAKPVPPKKDMEELRLETPEDETVRLAETAAEEAQYHTEIRAMQDVEVLVEAQTAQAERDTQKTNAILEKIASLPTINDAVPDTISARPVAQETALTPTLAVKPGKKSLFERLNFWEKKPVSPEDMADHFQIIDQVRNNLKKLLETGRFDGAAKLVDLDMLSKTLGIRDSRTRDGMFGPIIREQTSRMIRSGDGKSFREMLSSDMAYLGVANLLPDSEQLTLEELHNPEIARAVKEHFTDWVNSFSGVNNKLVAAFDIRRDFWVFKGFVTAEELNELPAVKKKVKEDIISRAKSMFDKGNSTGNPSEHFKSLKEDWAETGVYSEAEIDSWPEIQKITH